MARVVAVLLLVEAALSMDWLARLVPRLGIYGLTVIVFVVLRAAVTALEGAAGMMILRGRPAGPGFAQRALLVSAGLLTLEMGAGATPTSVFPTWRWPLVFAYWGYALAAVWLLERSARDRAID